MYLPPLPDFEYQTVEFSPRFPSATFPEIAAYSTNLWWIPGSPYPTPSTYPPPRPLSQVHIGLQESEKENTDALVYILFSGYYCGAYLLPW